MRSRIAVKAVEMIPQLLLTTVVLPLLGGLVCALILAARVWPTRLASLLVAASLLTVYVLLEGLPQFPPIASKQKLFFALALGSLAISQFSRRWPVSRLMVAVALGLTLFWLAGLRLFISSGPLKPLLCIITVAVAAFCGLRWRERDVDGFLWPASILSLAAGGAALSILGNFVGFGQVLGASAAFIGGLLLVKYATLIARPNGRGLELQRSVNEVMLFVVLAELLIIGLFAPDINASAFAILPLTLFVPLVAPSLGGMRRSIKPFAFGAMTSVPALLSIYLAARP